MKLRTLLLYWMIFSVTGHAKIITDGSTGSHAVLIGPHYSIDENIGRRSEANLFHSFQIFQLDRGERATFSGPSEIHNVITRVTGGQTSRVQGLIQSGIPGADFYFFNPAGWWFGEGASLDISGSLYLSSASRLIFTDGTTLTADILQTSHFSSAPPVSFGFLHHPPADITLQDTTIYLPAWDSVLSVSGGHLRVEDTNPSILEDSRLFARKRIALNTAAPGDELPVEGFMESPSSWPDHGEIQIRHEVLIGNQSSWETAHLSGDIQLRARKIGIADKASLLRMNAGSGTIRLKAQEISLAGSDINNLVHGTGNSLLELAAERITLTDSSLETAALWPGSLGGTIHLHADLITLQGSQINASTSPLSGNSAGGITFIAKEVVMRDDSLLYAGTLGSGEGGGIQINADQIFLQDSRMMTTAANMQGSTMGGHAGTININAVQTLRLGTHGRVLSRATGTSRGGDIVIQTQSLEMMDGGRVDSATFGKGQGGDILLHAHHLRLGGMPNDPAAISAASHDHGPSAGNAGAITLHARTLRLAPENRITSATRNASGGDIHIRAGQFVYLQQGKINTEVRGGDGNGGNITFQDVDALVMNQASIIARADEGRGGNITLQAAQRIGGEENNEINASSRLGIDGEISLLAPESDIDGQLIPPDIQLDNATPPRRCVTRRTETLENSFVLLAGPLAPPPSDLRPIYFSPQLPR